MNKLIWEGKEYELVLTPHPWFGLDVNGHIFTTVLRPPIDYPMEQSLWIGKKWYAYQEIKQTDNEA